jgi:hypothetical protein
MATINLYILKLTSNSEPHQTLDVFHTFYFIDYTNDN